VEHSPSMFELAAGRQIAKFRPLHHTLQTPNLSDT
jgi:hypothetical protein